MTSTAGRSSIGHNVVTNQRVSTVITSMPCLKQKVGNSDLGSDTGCQRTAARTWQASVQKHSGLAYL